MRETPVRETGGSVAGARTVRVFLVDDHEVVRCGLVEMLGHACDIEVVGEAATAAQALARIRAVRRQTLQPIIDQLAAEHLVTLAPNPAHARSPLVILTERGVAMVARLDRVDVAVLRAVGRGLAPRDLAITASTLRTLRAGFESSARWRPVAVAAR